MQNILKSYKHIIKFKTEKNKQKLHFDASETIFLEKKFNKIDSILFEHHFVFKEKIALPRECTDKEKDLIWEGKNKNQNKQIPSFVSCSIHIASV